MLLRDKTAVIKAVDYLKPNAEFINILSQLI